MTLLGPHMNALSLFLWHTAALANPVRQTPLENTPGHPTLPPDQSAHLACAAKNGLHMTP